MYKTIELFVDARQMIRRLLSNIHLRCLFGLETLTPKDNTSRGAGEHAWLPQNHGPLSLRLLLTLPSRALCVNLGLEHGWRSSTISFPTYWVASL